MRARYSVRGMGVALRVSTSTVRRSSLNCSLCFTPNFCSSSTITSPRSLKTISAETIRWVPMTISTAPTAAASMTTFCCLAVRKRLINSIRTGYSAMRSRKWL